MPKRKEKAPRSWIVRVTCTIVKEVVCEDCSKDEAQDRPWHFSVDESEVEMIDWDVTDVTPNA